jgi:carbamoyl-phosphate synthase small subunit
MKARLILEDGSVFEGVSAGIEGEKVGPVVLNTAVVGYQEMMTDPSNAGKILILTYPLIGNYGVADKFNESDKVWLAGLVIKEPSRIYSNWQARGSFDDFIRKNSVVTVSDIDTRTVAVTLRDKGEMLGLVTTKDSTKEELFEKIKAHKDKKPDFIKDISVKTPAKTKGRTGAADIAVLDLGMTRSLVKQLSTLGCNITLLPYNTAPADIMAAKYDGVVISCGPENDASIDRAADTVKALLGKIPMFGISLGHEIIGLALGGKLKKMKIGHHGVNYPIKPPDSFKGDVTVQNHSYAIDEDSIKSRKDVTISARNINDNSIEELESKTLKFISTQYIPASPGFDEINTAFLRFMKITGKASKASAQTKRPCEVQYAKA